MKNKSLLHRLQGFCKFLLGVALLSGINHTALAAQNTAQEKANMKLVGDFYAALENATAKGNIKEAIVGIAEKYIAPGYIQHAFGGASGRDNFIKLFQNRTGGGAPPAGPPAGAAPTGAPPGMPMQPQQAKLVALMADGNLVVQITSRGPAMIWNMFRIENGQLAEHWDANSTPAGVTAGGAQSTK